MRQTKKLLTLHRAALEQAQVGGAGPALASSCSCCCCCSRGGGSQLLLCLNAFRHYALLRWQAEYYAAKARWEEEKKRGKTPAKAERRESDAYSEWAPGREELVACLSGWCLWVRGRTRGEHASQRRQSAGSEWKGVACGVVVGGDG